MEEFSALGAGRIQEDRRMSGFRMNLGLAIVAMTFVICAPALAQTGGTSYPPPGGGCDTCPKPGDTTSPPPPGGGTPGGCETCTPPPTGGDTSGGCDTCVAPGGDSGGMTGGTGGGCDTCTGPSSDTSGSASSTTEEFTPNNGSTITSSSATGTHTVWLGTGEYTMTTPWHAVLRFDDAQAISGSVTPNATLPHASTTNASGITMDFGHDLYVTDDDDLYVCYTFSNDAGGEGCNVAPGSTESSCGSIGVMSGASSIDGGQVLTRQIYGANTGLHDPHGLWVDEARDLLYVANAWAGEVLVWENASTQNGDVAPTRVIDVSGEGYPIDVMLDEDADRLYVAMANSTNGSIGIYEEASTLSGTVSPDQRIVGSNTRISEGNNQTTHNSILIPDENLLVVGHHTNEVLIFDLDAITFGSTSSTVDYNLTPRIVYINESTDDTWDWSCYGIAYAEDGDELYVSAGYTAGGTSTSSSSPHRGGSPEHAIKIFPNISDASTSGFAAYREINWDNADEYYPPQPLWIQSSVEESSSANPTSYF